MAKAGCSGPTTTWCTARATTTADSRSWTHGASLTSTVLVELHHHIGDTMVAAFAPPAGCRRSASTSSRYDRADVPRDAGGDCCSRAARRVRNNALRGNSPFTAVPVRSREALEWATDRRRARLLMEDRIGTLSPGKKADIVMLRADDINMAPVYDPSIRSWRSPAPAIVDTVIIDGVVRKANGKLTFPPTCSHAAGSRSWRNTGARIMREAGYRVADRAGLRLVSWI
jgi:hypothetical protein